MFIRLKLEDSPVSPHLRTLCPTRWTVRNRAIDTVLKNYGYFVNFKWNLWKWNRWICLESKWIKARYGKISTYCTIKTFTNLANYSNLPSFLPIITVSITFHMQTAGISPNFFLPNFLYTVLISQTFYLQRLLSYGNYGWYSLVAMIRVFICSRMKQMVWP